MLIIRYANAKCFRYSCKLHNILTNVDLRKIKFCILFDGDSY